MVNPQAWEGKPLQLHGYVVPGSILKKTDTLEYKFKVQNNPARAAALSFCTPPTKAPLARLRPSSSIWSRCTSPSAIAVAGSCARPRRWRRRLPTPCRR